METRRVSEGEAASKFALADEEISRIAISRLTSIPFDELSCLAESQAISLTTIRQAQVY